MTFAVYQIIDVVFNLDKVFELLNSLKIVIVFIYALLALTLAYDTHKTRAFFKYIGLEFFVISFFVFLSNLILLFQSQSVLMSIVDCLGITISLIGLGFVLYIHHADEPEN